MPDIQTMATIRLADLSGIQIQKMDFNTSVLVELKNINQVLVKTLQVLNKSMIVLTTSMGHLIAATLGGIGDGSSAGRSGLQIGKLNRTSFFHEFISELGKLTDTAIQRSDAGNVTLQSGSPLTNLHTIIKSMSESVQSMEVGDATTTNKKHWTYQLKEAITKPFKDMRELMYKSPTGGAGQNIGSAFGVGIKKLLNPLKTMVKSMGQMAKMAMVTEPLMAFLGGLFKPFKMLSKLLGAMGLALGADLVPLVMEMMTSMVEFFPMMVQIMPIITKILIVIWKYMNPLGVLSNLIGETGDKITTFALSGALPEMNTQFTSAFTNADNVADSFFDLGEDLGMTREELENYEGIWNPITNELKILSDTVSDAVTFDLTGLSQAETDFGTFIDDLNGKAGELNSNGGGGGNVIGNNPILPFSFGLSGAAAFFSWLF